MNWLRKIFQEEKQRERPQPNVRPHRKIGINKAYDPLIWQKNRFREKNLNQS